VDAPDEPEESARALADDALHLYESEPGRAERLARRALDVMDGLAADDDDRARSIAHHALGMVAWERQAIPDALEQLRLAVVIAERAGELTTAARARSSLALVLSYAGDDAGALAEADAAAPFLTGVQRAELDHHVSGILEREGRLREALELATKAWRAFRRAGDVLWQAKALNNRGIILAQLGESDAARRQFDQAEQLYADLDATLGRLKVQNNRAWLAGLKGDIPGALRLREGLQRELEALGVPPGLFRLDHAGVLLAAALPSEALAVAEQAARELADEGMMLDRAEALLIASLAARLAGSVDTAERLGRSAIEAFEAQRRPAWVLRAQHALIDASWAAGRHDDATRELARSVADELDGAGWRDWAGDVHLLVGQMALASGDLEEAAERLRMARRTRRHATRAADAAGLEARLHAARGDLRSARSAVRRGLRYFEQNEAILGATELRVRAARQAADLADLGLRWAISSGRAAHVLLWAERRRAASLRRPPIRPPANRAMAKLLTARRAASFAADQLDRAQDFHAGPALEAHRLVARLDAELRDHSRMITGTGVAVPHTSIDTRALVAALGPTALVELISVDDVLFAVTVVDGRFTLEPLASLRDVQQELSYTRSALATATVSASGRGFDPLLASLRHLDELVAAPLRGRLEDRDLVVVPLASLHTLPWGSLPSLATRAVSIAPSATTWLAAKVLKRRPHGPVVVAAGPELHHAEGEALAVARTAGAHRILVGDGATARGVARAIDGASIVHLACHGRFNADNPQFSSLLFYDGPVTVYEMEKLRRAPELVVLSSCHSAVGSASAGDELMGLTASLLALGSRALVGAVAPVLDEWTRPLMLAFHEQLADGEAPATALASARAATADAGPAAMATAVAFGCYGAGS
jgi:tetratricopeptide (TPR) repeat protein